MPTPPEMESRLKKTQEHQVQVLKEGIGEKGFHLLDLLTKRYVSVDEKITCPCCGLRKQLGEFEREKKGV